MRLPSLSVRTVAAGFRITGFSQVDDALEEGHGVILALPHLGGWEWAGRWLADRNYKVNVVVEKLEPPELFDWFVRLRSELGMTVIPLGPSAAATVLRALRDNEIVCLLCDRDLHGGGVEVDFFGEVTTLPAGPATLGLRAGAPILPVGCYFTRRVNGHHTVVRPRLPMERSGKLRDDITRVTQDLARRARGPDPPCSRAVALVPTELAQRSRIPALALDRAVDARDGGAADPDVPSSTVTCTRPALPSAVPGWRRTGPRCARRSSATGRGRR